MNENVHSLIGAYAVDAVTPDERADFEAHLSACEDCTAELAGLRETAAMLGEADVAAAPAGLRASVLEEIGRTAQLPPLTEDDAAVARDAEGPVPLEAAREARQDRHARTRRGWPRLAVAAAVASVLAVGGLVGSTLMADRDDQLALEKDVMMVTSAPDAKSMDLGLGTAHLVVSERMSTVVAMGDDCPHPKDGMAYQLWLVMDDGSKEAGPTFMPDADGTFMTMVHMDMEGVAAVAVTEEPMGGSTEPTSTEVAVVEL
ncbi:anti-sigma factor [Demequina sp. SYSU T00192]|uniref:Regulator of SigK n=1 Tax=Demequina litoralis TaxID=3051660 RepID=A0ABT8G9V9_9MICO|nr:anti-sigma factor [Demequina sp. SYSU T00192]MDN4475764.1 anti-sigma factor [Demequina sp. SYSU T00192]